MGFCHFLIRTIFLVRSIYAILFCICSDEEEELESEEDESSEDESVVESEEESEVELDSDEEEGLDWDELEEQAKKEDKSRTLSDDDEPSRKRKHNGSTKNGKRMRG